MLDEPHPAHVGGEVVDPLGPVDRLAAGLGPAEVELHDLRSLERLVPLARRAPVYGADLGARAQQLGGEVAADEPAGAGDQRRRAHQLFASASAADGE